MKPSSAIFFKDKTVKSLINLKLSFSIYPLLKKALSVFIPAVLLTGIIVSTQGCAAQKCDCPKFGGKHLKH